MSEANDFNERNIAEFRANHGRVGGNFEGAPLVVLHTVGARSGEPRTNIMMYRPDGDRYLTPDRPGDAARLIRPGRPAMPARAA